MPGNAGRVGWHDIRHTALYGFYWALRDQPNQKELLKQTAGHSSDSAFELYHRLALIEDAQHLLGTLHRNPANRGRPEAGHVETLDDILATQTSGSFT